MSSRQRCVLEVLKFLSASEVLTQICLVSRGYCSLCRSDELWFDLIDSVFSTSPPADSSPQAYFRVLSTKTIPVISRNSVSLFCIASERWLDVKLSTSVEIDRLTSIVLLRDQRLFATGLTDDSGDTISIDFRRGAVTYLSPLKYHRNSIGVVRVQGLIYAFCGFDKGYKQHCEAFDIKSQEWTELPASIYVRSGFNPAENKGKVYLIGGCGTTFGEYFDLISNVFTTIPVVTPGMFCTIAIIVETDLIAVQEHGYYRYEVDNPQSVCMTAFEFDLGTSLWSASAVVEFRGEQFIRQASNRRILALDIEKKKYRELGDNTEMP